MALGNHNQQSNRKLLILKLKSKDENDVPMVPNMFQVSEKVDDKWVARPELVDRVSGKLAKVELGEGEWNKKKYGTVKLYLEDGDECYLLDLRYNSLSRNLFNSLAALEAFDNLSISNYRSKSKKDGKEYAAISLWQGDKMIKGKVELTALPQPDVIKNKAGEVVQRDYTEVDAFYKTQLEALVPKVAAAASAAK